MHSNKSNGSLLKLGGGGAWHSLVSKLEETKKLQLMSSELSLASSQVTKIQCPHFRTTFDLLNTPARFNGLPHSMVAGALRALPSIM